MLKNWILLFLIALAFDVSIHAKEFRGITPLHSNKEDVIRILGKPTKVFDGRYFYKLEKEEAVVWLNKNVSCDDFGIGWNVPVGTVISISVIPFKKLPLAELKLNEKVFKTYPINNLGFVYLQNETEGFEIETLNGLVTALKYEQEQKDSDKRCPQKRDCCIDFFPVEEFLHKSLNWTKAYLDGIASIYSKESDISRMYLIVESKFEAKAKRTAILAKKYLVNAHKFNPTHIIAASGKGDFGETTNAKNDVKISVWIKPIGGNFNKPPYASETVKAIKDEIS